MVTAITHPWHMAVTVAIEWWGNQLTGMDEASSRVSQAQLQCFDIALRTELDTYLLWQANSNMGGVDAVLVTDAAPVDMLARALRAAGITAPVPGGVAMYIGASHVLLVRAGGYRVYLYGGPERG